MRVLVIGATGQFAGLVVPALVSRSVQVRAFVHDPAKQGQAKGAGADETATGDLRDPASVRAALDGVDGVFLIIPAFAPDTAALGTGIVAAAQSAGVRRVVFSGVYHPSLALVNHASTRPVEEALYHSDLEFTVLQPAMFMQGLLGGWQSAVGDGVFVAPYSKDSAMTFVDYRDVAEAAAIAFATDDLVNGTFELAAGGTVTRTEIAALMTRYAGREVTAQDVEPGAALQQMPAGPMKDGLLAMFADYTAHGFRGGNSLALRSIIGRTPRSLDDFFAELAR
ncbi:MAG TPA: NmrA family NAD(P)-binding protein [Streptosporangiaceae bacterium]|nr:NmrA family NAD(P)-binding protein [Streptosporangiaceae bacterium]